MPCNCKPKPSLFAPQLQPAPSSFNFFKEVSVDRALVQALPDCRSSQGQCSGLQLDGSVALRSPEGLGIPRQVGLSQGANFLPLHVGKSPAPQQNGLFGTPSLPCPPESHLPGLKRVVDVKRGILRAASVLDHRGVLRAESWGSAGIWCLWGNSQGPLLNCL